MSEEISLKQGEALKLIGAEPSIEMLKNLIKSGELETLLNSQELKFPWLLKILDQFKEDEALKNLMHPRNFLLMIMSLMEGFSKQKEIYKKSYFKLNLEISTGCRLFIVAGYINNDNDQDFWPAIILVGFISKNNSIKNIKSNLKDSGILFLKESKGSLLFREENKITPIHDNISRKPSGTFSNSKFKLQNTMQILIKEKNNYIEEFWRCEGLKVDSPKLFFLTFLKLLSCQNSEKELNPNTYNKYRLSFISEMNPFRACGVIPDVLINKECYRYCKSLKKIELFSVFEQFIHLLTGNLQIGIDFNSIEREPLIKTISLLKIETLINLCIYIKLDDFESESSDQVRKCYKYKARFFKQNNLNEILESVNKENVKIIKDNKSGLIKNVKSFFKGSSSKEKNLNSLILESKRLNFKSLESFTSFSENVILFLIFKSSLKFNEFTLVDSSNLEVKLKKNDEHFNQGFSIFSIETTLIVNSKITIKYSSSKKTIKFKYTGTKALFLTIEGRKKLDYDSFLFFLNLILKISRPDLLDSLLLEKKNIRMSFETIQSTI